MLEPSYLVLNHLAYSSFNTILTKSFKKIPITLKLFSKVSSFKYSKHIFATSLQNKMINSFKYKHHLVVVIVAILLINMF